MFSHKDEETNDATPLLSMNNEDDIGDDIEADKRKPHLSSKEIDKCIQLLTTKKLRSNSLPSCYQKGLKISIPSSILSIGASAYSGITLTNNFMANTIRLEELSYKIRTYAQWRHEASQTYIDNKCPLWDIFDDIGCPPSIKSLSGKCAELLDEYCYENFRIDELKAEFKEYNEYNFNSPNGIIYSLISLLIALLATCLFLIILKKYVSKSIDWYKHNQPASDYESYLTENEIADILSICDQLNIKVQSHHNVNDLIQALKDKRDEAKKVETQFDSYIAFLTGACKENKKRNPALYRFFKFGGMDVTPIIAEHVMKKSLSQ